MPGFKRMGVRPRRVRFKRSLQQARASLDNMRKHRKANEIALAIKKHQEQKKVKE